MLSQFYILSTRGDIIISRNFRDQCLKNIPDIFFRNVKSEKSIETPIFQVDGIVFFFLKRNGLYFVCTTQQNVNPSYILETLQKIICVIKDFCGVLSEEALRRNFILAYEIIDEVIDCGYPQHTSTEKLKQNIRTEAILLEDLPHPEKLLNCSSFGKTLRAFETNTVAQIPYQKTIPSSASHRPVGLARRETPPLSLKNGASHVVASFMQLTKKTLSGNNALSLPTGNNANEIFVDVLEKINVVTNSLGTVLRSYIDGRIQVKSYLSGYPSLCVILNPDLQLKSDPLRKNHIKDYSTSDYFSSSFIAPPEIDDYNFHECVDFSEFQSSKYLYFSPPDGEFVLMNYRITDPFKIPFVIKPTLKEISPTQLDLIIEVKACIPRTQFGGNIVLTCPVPANTLSVNISSSLNKNVQNAEYNHFEKKLVWTTMKLQGESSMCLQCRIILSNPLVTNGSKEKTLLFLRKEINPILMTFEIPMYNISSLQVQCLRIQQQSAEPGVASSAPVENSFRWVRYVTQSHSYVCRL